MLYEFIIMEYQPGSNIFLIFCLPRQFQGFGQVLA
jgi:hypothetical protein